MKLSVGTLSTLGALLTAGLAARAELVVYDGTVKSVPLAADGRSLRIAGMWDVSACGEIAVEFERAPQGAELGDFCPHANYMVRLLGRCGEYAFSVRRPLETTSFAFVIPPRMDWMRSLESKLRGFPTCGLRDLVWPHAGWCPGYPEQIRSWTLDPHAVTNVTVACAGYLRGLPPVKRIVVRGQANRIENPPKFYGMTDEEFFPFVDRYGQFVHRDWPGKIRTDADLKRAAAEEARDLAAHPGPRGWDKWGGWADGPQLRATGHFRVEKVKGKWWFVDPDGRLWWSQGPVRVSTGCSLTPYHGRENYFSWLPGADSPFAAFYKPEEKLMWPYYEKWGATNVFDFVLANLYRKYGPDWRQRWRDLAHRRLRSWGANTIANGSAPEVCALRRTPYCDRIDVKARPISGTIAHSGWWPFRDVFDPSFRRCVREQLLAHKAELDDPWCFGFFVDNEHSTGQRPCLGRWTLESPADQPARIEFERRLRAKYGKVPEKVSDEDCGDFSVALLEEYFRIVREEFKSIAPHKLYLGCRYSTPDPFAVYPAEKHVDVMSFNYYRKDVTKFDHLPAGIDKPVLVGEFHFGALDRGPIHPSCIQVRDQRERAETYRRYLVSALKDPRFVGVHWHQYLDNVPTGRFDGENFQNGWVDVCDTPYAETVEAVRWVGDNMYRIRFEDGKGNEE